MKREDSSNQGVPEDAPSPCDARALARIRKWGGEKLVRDLLDIFAGQAPERIRAAREGLRAGDAAAAERAAHALRSSCAQLGAVRMLPLCEAIEHVAGRRELGLLPALLDTLEHEFAEYAKCLPEAIQESGEIA